MNLVVRVAQWCWWATEGVLGPGGSRAFAEAAVSLMTAMEFDDRDRIGI